MFDMVDSVLRQFLKNKPAFSSPVKESALKWRKSAGKRTKKDQRNGQLSQNSYEQAPQNQPKRPLQPPHNHKV